MDRSVQSTSRLSTSAPITRIVSARPLATYASASAAPAVLVLNAFNAGGAQLTGQRGTHQADVSDDLDISIGKPMDSTGRTADSLMRDVEAWIEAEMRRLDPEAYP